MSKIENAIKRQSKAFEKEIDRKISYLIKNKMLRIWNGKKIVSIEEWEGMMMDSKLHKALEFIPEDYVEDPFFSFPPGDKELLEKRNDWNKFYLKFLEENKKPGYGKKLCENCILNPSPKLKFVSIRDVVARSLRFKSNRKFPCDIVNFFNCPYKPEDNKFLIYLGYMCKIIDDALYFAHSLSSYENQKTFVVDFVGDIVEEYLSRSSTTPISVSRIAMSFSNFKLSKVEVLWIEDIYNAITDKKTLDVLLEQYIDSVASDYYYSGKKSVESEKRAGEIRQFKDGIIKIFMGIKNTIKLDDLSGIHGITLEEEKKEKQRLDRIKKWILKEHPEEAAILDLSRYGKCTTCEGFANIHCTNCDIWVCNEHWRLHKDFHGKDKIL